LRLRNKRGLQGWGAPLPGTRLKRMPRVFVADELRAAQFALASMHRCPMGEAMKRSLSYMSMVWLAGGLSAATYLSQEPQAEVPPTGDLRWAPRAFLSPNLTSLLL
jgi:hypothetical protein